MNLRGSWRRLLGNSESATLAAVEIYNKPRLAYRDEVFVILLMNSWELLLKAIVSKAGKRIYYPKKRGEPYRTLGWSDAFWRAANSSQWPRSVEKDAVRANLDVLSVYRDSSVHFYNNTEFGSLIYSLAQTCIMNFRDVAVGVFGRDLAKKITWRIMPLGIESPVDPLVFMRGGGRASSHSSAVQDFLGFLRERADSLDKAGVSTDRFFTVFDVALNSVKKIDKADIVVGVAAEDAAEAVVVQRRVDPNVSHPYRRKDVLPKLSNGLSTFEFDAVVRVNGVIGDPRYCWRDDQVGLVKWSPELIGYLNRLSPEEVAKARTQYTVRRKKRKES